jgi:2-polyprenyl-3-methyl-5-hydroxy-6-metoxy-1,4-benzoquinol methylase
MNNSTAYQLIEQEVLRAWPDHAAALAKARPTDINQRETQERVSALILNLVGEDIGRHIHGYQWMCQMVLDEELEFRRNGRYRLSSFAEAERTVYANKELMARYMDGLLLSQVLWANHIAIMDYYLRDFLGEANNTASHLEIGPGHGLLIFLASKATTGSLTCWDVSQTSLNHTQLALARLGARPGISLVERNLFTDLPMVEQFDSVVISEVLEHLENPAAALEELFRCMTPGGRLFVNAPVNSPAIDHIFLFRTPEELVDLVISTGFKVESIRIAPASGFTEERARKFGVAISCAIICRRAV